MACSCIAWTPAFAGDHQPPCFKSGVTKPGKSRSTLQTGRPLFRAKTQRGRPGPKGPFSCIQWIWRCVGQGKPLSDKRSEEHTSELQSLMRISYAVYCLTKKKTITAQKKH